MRKIITPLLSIILLPLFVGLMVAALEPHIPKAIKEMIEWLVSLGNWSETPMIVIGIVGYIAGLWSDKLIVLFNKSDPRSKKIMAEECGVEASRLAEAMENSTEADLSQIFCMQRYIVLSEKLKALELDPPKMTKITSQQFKILSPYLAAISVPLLDSDLIQARIADSRVGNAARKIISEHERNRQDIAE